MTTIFTFNPRQYQLPVWGRRYVTWARYNLHFDWWASDPLGPRHRYPDIYVTCVFNLKVASRHNSPRLLHWKWKAHLPSLDQTTGKRDAGVDLLTPHHVWLSSWPINPIVVTGYFKSAKPNISDSTVTSCTCWPCLPSTESTLTLVGKQTRSLTALII